MWEKTAQKHPLKQTSALVTLMTRTKDWKEERSEVTRRSLYAGLTPAVSRPPTSSCCLPGFLCGSLFLMSETRWDSHRNCHQRGIWAFIGKFLWQFYRNLEDSTRWPSWFRFFGFVFSPMSHIGGPIRWDQYNELEEKSYNLMLNWFFFFFVDGRNCNRLEIYGYFGHGDMPPWPHYQCDCDPQRPAEHGCIQQCGQQHLQPDCEVSAP